MPLGFHQPFHEADFIPFRVQSSKDDNPSHIFKNP
jgi:hypothetical protein